MNDEQGYLDLLQNILTNGTDRSDRTGVGTKGIFGTQLRFSLENDQIPMLTTKKMFARGIVEELLFFIRGETDTKLLEAKGVNIWKGNTSREFLDKKGLNHFPEGSLGKGYGYQWRKFGSVHVKEQHVDIDSYYNFKTVIPAHDTQGVDQVKQVLHTLQTNPTDRRMIITAWNPLQLHEMALPPCHMMVQFYVDDGNLSAQWYQRSVDAFLGLPFNIMSYAVLTKIMAQAAGLKAKELVFVGGDTHIYQNHLDQVREQLTRTPFPLPTMQINKPMISVEDMERLQWEDFTIENYQSHPAIKAPMAV